MRIMYSVPVYARRDYEINIPEEDFKKNGDKYAEEVLLEYAKQNDIDLTDESYEVEAPLKDFGNYDNVDEYILVEEINRKAVRSLTPVNQLGGVL